MLPTPIDERIKEKHRISNLPDRKWQKQTKKDEVRSFGFKEADSDSIQAHRAITFYFSNQPSLFDDILLFPHCIKVASVNIHEPYAMYIL